MSLQSLDTGLLLFINHSTANRFFDVLMPFLSARGYYLILPFIFFMFLIGNNRKNAKGETFLKAALWTLLIACCAVFFAEVMESVLKNTVARVRPCSAIQGVRLIIPCPRSYSMPSGHALSSFACAVPLFYLTRAYLSLAWRLYPLVLASLIAFSRAYLGVHYPSDIIVGVLCGTFFAMGLSLLYQRRESKRT